MKDVPWRNLVELKLCLINFDSVTLCKLEFEQKVLKNLYVDLFCMHKLKSVRPEQNGWHFADNLESALISGHWWMVGHGYVIASHYCPWGVITCSFLRYLVSGVAGTRASAGLGIDPVDSSDPRTDSPCWAEPHFNIKTIFPNIDFRNKIDGSVQDCSNFIVNALESCTKPSKLSCPKSNSYALIIITMMSHECEDI